MTAVLELLHEAIAEIGAKPVVFAVEVLQFVVLVIAIKLLASRILGPMLDRRRAGIESGLEEAAGADERIAEAEREAKQILAEARREAKQRVGDARQSSAAAHEEALVTANGEAAGLIEQARETLRQEREDATSTARAQLVDLVTIATRGVLDEALSESERRELVERSVLTSLDELEDVALAE